MVVAENIFKVRGQGHREAMAVLQQRHTIRQCGVEARLFVNRNRNFWETECIRSITSRPFQ